MTNSWRRLRTDPTVQPQWWICIIIGRSSPKSWNCNGVWICATFTQLCLPNWISTAQCWEFNMVKTFSDLYIFKNLSIFVRFVAHISIVWLLLIKLYSFSTFQYDKWFRIWFRKACVKNLLGITLNSLRVSKKSFKNQYCTSPPGLPLWKHHGNSKDYSSLTRNH